MPTSRSKRRMGLSTVFGAALFSLAVAVHADPPGHDPGEGSDHDGRPHHGAADNRDRPDHPEHSDHPEHPDHPDHPHGPDRPNPGLHLGWEQETPEQRAAKTAARRALEIQIADAVHKDGKSETAEERELIRAQWRRHARLWKIRELAEVGKDAAVVEKCDQLLARSNAWLVKKLQDLNANETAGGAK